MSEKNNKSKRRFNFGLGEAGNEERTRKAAIHMICGFTLMTLLMIAVITIIMTLKLDNAVRNQATSFIDIYNDEVADNVSLYMQTVEKNVGMIFGNESYYTYDPTLALGSVDAVMEAKLAADLSVYSSLGNYIDFCVAYPDGHTVGQLSDKTWGYYGADLYDSMAKVLDGGNESWLSGPGNSYDILYYLHRINENAIMIASVSMSEIDAIFKLETNSVGMDTYLINNAFVVQTSTAGDGEIGSYLKSGIYRLADRDDKVKISRLYLVCTTAIAGNDWYVLTAIPYSNITAGLLATKLSIIIIGALILVLAILFTILMTRRLIKNVNQTVGKLDVKSQTDLLTGLLNKKSFEEIVNLTLAENFDQSGYALVFMDVDNFKGVNDKCGHDVGDDVLRSFSHTIGSVFRDEDIKGRLGGDEFCVLMKLPHDCSPEEMSNRVKDVCSRFRDALHKKAATGRQSMPAVTSSMGAVISTAAGETFENMYHKADTALYHSKHKGKDTYSIYGEE